MTTSPASVQIVVSLLLAAGCGRSSPGERAARDRAALEEAASGRATIDLRGDLVARFSGTIVLEDAPRDPGARALVFLERFAGAFGIVGDVGPDPLRVASAVAIERGGHVVRVERSHHGVPVFGAEAIVHLDAAGAVVNVVAALPTALSLDVTPTTARPEGAELVIVDHGLFGDGGSGHALAWKARVVDAEGASDVVSDAHTGAPIVTLEADDEAQLFETCQGAAGACTTIWFDGTGQIKTGTPPDPVTRAHGFVVQAAARHVTGTGRASWDGKGTLIRTIVQPMTRRAFWRAESASVFVRPDSVALDVIAHELGHGVVRASVPELVGGGLSGAVGEGLADVFASLTDGNWTLGESLAGGPLRDLRTPRHARDVKMIVKALWDRQANDMGYVHANGMMIGHAFHLLTEGCSAGVCALVGAGVGADKALAIAHRIVAHHLTKHADLLDVAHGARAACKAFRKAGASVVTSPADCAAVINAFHAVGLGPRDRDRDGVPDGEDNCGDIFNPDQVPSAEDPLTGKACIHHDGSAPVKDGGVGDFGVASIEERSRRTAAMCGTSNDAMIEVTISHTRRYLMMPKQYLDVQLDTARRRAANVGGPWSQGTRRVGGGDCVYGQLDLVKVEELGQGLSQAEAAALIKRETAGKAPVGSDVHTIAMPDHGTKTRVRAGEIRAR
ncbi:MAG: M4 family metallopeptidase [Deltaproteobacteria bacterium]|nr:M4 family metallopeptidase [Deltaproteobacteria bacterium]